MISPLQKTSLHELLGRPILFDANIFMVGIENRATDKLYSFDSIKEVFVLPIFESFLNILIHEEVYRELDLEARAFVDSYDGKNVSIVREDDLYGKDPQYTTIFNNIAEHELVCYQRGVSQNRGEVYSLAYAAYHNINYFCSKDAMVDLVAQDLADLNNVTIVTFDVILLLAYVYYARKSDNSHSKAQKAMYKLFCDDVIKRHKLPKTLGEYIKAFDNCL